MNPDLQLMKFQDTGSALLARSKRAMLAWDPGTGKTPTAVIACQRISAERVLVFCPPIATSVWRQHFKDWSDYRDIRVLTAQNVVTPFTFVEGKGVRIIPFSYMGREMNEAVVKAASRFSDQWDAVIIDECHYLKNSAAKRTRAVYGAKLDGKNSPIDEARHVWALSGTPLLNHPAELWTHLHAMRPDLLIVGNIKDPLTEQFFINHYCVTKLTRYGTRIVGAKNATELAERIKPFMDRKRLRDVIKDMPPLRIVDHPLPADTPIDPNLRESLNEALEKMELDIDALDDDQLLNTVQAGGVAFSTVRRLIGEAKAPAVAALVDDELNDAQDEKVIVFAHHRGVIEKLAQLLVKHHPLVIHGATSHGSREKGIEMFQNDNHHRLIIIAVDAAGEAITLHRAHNVIIAEPSPVPARNHQAIARAHRKGQNNAVLARFVLLPGTLDARLMSIIARKTREIARVIDPDLAEPEKKQMTMFPEETV